MFLETVGELSQSGADVWKVSSHGNVDYLQRL